MKITQKVKIVCCECRGLSLPAYVHFDKFMKRLNEEKKRDWIGITTDPSDGFLIHDGGCPAKGIYELQIVFIAEEEDVT